MTAERKPSREEIEFYLAVIYEAAASAGSVAFTRFTGHVVAGMGAVLGLVFANFDTLHSFVAIGSVAAASYVFLLALFLAVVERGISAWIAAATSSASEVRRAIREQAVSPNAAAIPIIHAEIRAATFGLARLMQRKAPGPHTLRNLYRRALLQGHIALLSAGLCVVSASILVCGLRLPETRIVAFSVS